MTSFPVQESINYARENQSKRYVCFLDVKQAFDNVWHTCNGLFLKIDALGIDRYIWKAIVCHNLVSNLAFFGYLRVHVQDKVDTLPFFLFLCFENDLCLSLRFPY